MKYKNRKKIKRHFVYTSIIRYLYFLIFSEMKYTSSILLILKKKFFLGDGLQIYFCFCKQIHKLRKSTLSILQSFKMNTSILKVSFKYTSEFKHRYKSLESLLQAYFWVSKINISILKVYSKYTSKIRLFQVYFWKINFLYTSECEHKYICLESLLQVYF